MNCEFIIKNGTVFDSVNAVFQKRDVYINNGKILNEIPEDQYVGATVIDAEGKYVLPGLIDEHAHLNLYGSIIGANADTMCIPNGVTSAVDGGTTGASGFELFYNSNIIRYESDVMSYLNVSTFGNKSLCKHEEDHDPDDFREDLIIKLFQKYPNTLRGLKVRMCKGTLGEYGMAPLHKAIDISKKIQLLGYHCPVVVHYDNLPDNVTVQELFQALRPGDIAAHIYQTKGETIFDSNAKVLPYVKEAQARGVIMDDCHGRVHWSFDHLKKAFADEFYPDIISSDLVRVSEYVRPGFSLVHAMCVLSAVGLSIERILKAVTYNPAAALGILEKAGTLKAGTVADIAIMDIVDTDMEFTDFYGGKLKGNKMFIPLLTMREGRVAYRQIFF